MSILIVEDNDLIRNGLRYYLESEGFNVLESYNIDGALDLIEEADLIILDVTLPDGSGFDLAKNIKENNDKPIIFLTAKDQDVDIDTGLMVADDYIIKPFRNRELLLRINNILKRNNGSIIKINDYIINSDTLEVIKGENKIELSSLEYKLLSLLARNKNKVLTMDYLLNFIYDITGNYVNDNTLRVYIKRIREKCNDEDLIKNVKGVGYKIDEKKEN